MTRPRAMTTRYEFRCSEEDLALLSLAALADERQLSDWCRLTLRKAAAARLARGDSERDIGEVVREPRPVEPV